MPESYRNENSFRNNSSLTIIYSIKKNKASVLIKKKVEKDRIGYLQQ